MRDDEPVALFAKERARFHAGLLSEGILSVNDNGIASNADSGSRASTAYALHVARALRSETVKRRLPGQTSGGHFEAACTDFIRATFSQLGHLRPGVWTVQKVGSRGAAAGVARFEQYSHLVELNRAIKTNRSLQSVLGNGYAIAPDIVVYRSPIDDVVINRDQFLVDDAVARRASLRARFQPAPILHAVVSCKWTLRSDRAQNARSEALNLIRNRKGRLPHAVVLTAEPTPARISSLALGTGDIDCVYHFALPELVDAVKHDGGGDTGELLDTMIAGKRLKDIADLPLDLAT